MPQKWHGRAGTQNSGHDMMPRHAAAAAVCVLWPYWPKRQMATLMLCAPAGHLHTMHHCCGLYVTEPGGLLVHMELLAAVLLTARGWLHPPLNHTTTKSTSAIGMSNIHVRQ